MIYAVDVWLKHSKIKFEYPSIAKNGKYYVDFAVTRKGAFLVVPFNYPTGWYNTRERAEKSVSKVYKKECIYGLRRNR